MTMGWGRLDHGCLLLIPSLLRVGENTHGVGVEHVEFGVGWRCFTNPNESGKIKMKHIEKR